MINENRQYKEVDEEKINYNVAVEAQIDFDDRTVIDIEEGSTNELVER